jgi:predicted RNA-binding protein YlxR (DUF448 family)
MHPVRMCAGCRERHSQYELIRLQMTREGIVIVERPDQRQPGRSLYLCPDPDCFSKLLRRGPGIVFKASKYDKITVRLEPRQLERLRYAFEHAARRFKS